MSFAKIFAALLFPIGILQILYTTDIISWNHGNMIGIIGASLMIFTQLLSLHYTRSTNGNTTIIHLLSFVIFVGAAGYYLVATIFNIGLWPSMPLVLGVAMFIEGMYAMH